jgi:hypothetical protein
MPPPDVRAVDARAWRRRRDLLRTPRSRARGVVLFFIKSAEGGTQFKSKNNEAEQLREDAWSGRVKGLIETAPMAGFVSYSFTLTLYLTIPPISMSSMLQRSTEQAPAASNNLLLTGNR